MLVLLLTWRALQINASNRRFDTTAMINTAQRNGPNMTVTLASCRISESVEELFILMSQQPIFLPNLHFLRLENTTYTLLCFSKVLVFDYHLSKCKVMNQLCE